MATEFFTLATDVAPKPYRTHQGPGVVLVGAVTTNDPTSMPTMVALGLTDTDIELSPNIETSEVRSAQMRNPHNLIITAWAWQITAGLDHIDPWNMSLAFGYDVSDTVTVSSILTLNGQCGSPYRAFRLMTEGPTNTGSLTKATRNVDFYKTRVVSNGGMTISRETKSTLPIMVHGLGNSADTVGVITNTEAIADPGYE